MAAPTMTTKPRATAPAARMDPHTARRGMFVLEDGRNVVFTFFLLVFLFALWCFCNGMIDVMDKHFQEELHLNLAQSAWVQFAHYLGYFLMAIPAGWLAIKLGYKGGIIAGLLMVAAGGFWFIPASHIAQFWAFLLGVCVIAAGLTFLETIANPYTTVLGPPQYAATRINLAQSINGIGLLLGPIAGGAFFYSKNAAGISTGSERLWIPYAFIGVVVVVLSIIFFFAPMPNIEMEDDYHIDESRPDARQSIWSHPHFWMAVLAQFLYVAAQAGIFSFFINYMTSQVPPVPASWQAPGVSNAGFFSGWIETHRNGVLGFSNKAASNLASLGFLCFLIGRFTGSAILKKFTPYKVLGWYSAAAVALCLLIFAKLGWVSVACVFLTYFFMSIMFPQIFALGFFGLGQYEHISTCFIVITIIGETEQFANLLDRVENTSDNVVRTGWGGVVITLHEHPRVQKYLVVRKGGYLALEMHEQKDERLEVREGAGLILWRPANARSLTVEVLRPGAEFHFQPGIEHCIIGAEDLLVFERSVDPKGMDQDLIFIYEPDTIASPLPSHAG